uniref:Uncharacterized protein n=1 Tax=Rhizophora mucronata TaxID=61149 RepID=A0A2P2N629_RHIMU
MAVKSTGDHPELTASQRRLYTTISSESSTFKGKSPHVSVKKGTRLLKLELLWF